MAAKRQRSSGKWEYVIRRKGLLPKPVNLYFDDEKIGDEYVRKLEALLDVGIVPDELVQRRVDEVRTLGDVVRAYLREAVQGASDVPLLERICERSGAEDLAAVSTYAWVEQWIAEMKRVDKLSPGTIKHYVGALARCLSWALTRHWIAMNPCRMLPKRYASYSSADTAAAGVERANVERDRRLADDEEKRIRGVLWGHKPAHRQRALDLPHAEALRCIFDLALESAMRLREMYTLTRRQVDFDAATIFLDKTKNGDKRQVPMSSVARRVLEEYLSTAEFGADDLIFPWWDGDGSPRKLVAVTARLSRQFARIFSAAQCDDLHFHDLRHEATSRLYERTDWSDVEISEVTGHKDLRMLKRYANLRGSDLAKRMW